MLETQLSKIIRDCIERGVLYEYEFDHILKTIIEYGKQFQSDTKIHNSKRSK